MRYHIRTKDNNVLPNNFRELKHIVGILPKLHQESKDKLIVQRKFTSTN